MLKGKLKTEDKIFQAALNVFLLYGYHGTTLHQIAIEAGVQKSAVHYYFRSKNKLYEKVVKYLLGTISETDDDKDFNNTKNEKLRWFLFTELYNNHQLFEKIIRNLDPDKWEKRLEKIKNIKRIK